MGVDGKVGARAQTLLGGIIRCECSAPMHGTIIGFITQDLCNGTLASPEAYDTQAELQSDTERLTDKPEEVAHVGSVLLDVKLKSLHAGARGELAALETPRMTLIEDRDSILARAGADGGLSAFM